MVVARVTSWARFSVRQRITSAVALLTALALVAVGVTLYAVETRRIDRGIDAGLAQEIGEFRALQAEGKDPETGQAFASVDRLIEAFLESNLPDAHEMLFGFPIAGVPQTVGEGDRTLERSPAFTALVERHRRTGGTYDLTVGSTRYRIAIQAVNDGTSSGAFVVSHNVSASRDELQSLMTTYALVAALALLTIATLASFVAGRLLGPVRRLNETAQGISGGDLSKRIEVTGNDDLTELQRTFNAMLARLEESFATQRQLLDDAGHELRTPLTVLRGHLELVDVHDPDEVTATRDLLIDEVDRMTRLVGDLLMLAKARRPDFIASRPLDVGLLTRDVLDKARALGQRRWTLDAAASGTVVIDGQRVTQALLQLLDNAVRHTTDGDEIALGSTLDDASAVFWVRDTGPGVASENRQRIFDRFDRGGEVNDDGFGLGLAIVGAIAEAHGGRVSLDDTPVGATFRLTLPQRNSP